MHARKGHFPSSVMLDHNWNQLQTVQLELGIIQKVFKDSVILVLVHSGESVFSNCAEYNTCQCPAKSETYAQRITGPPERG